MNTHDFTTLMQKLAAAWSTQDTESALDCFTSEAVYIEPPDIQYFAGQVQLRAYFGALKPGTSMVFHHLWFDEALQTGAGEFSFGIWGREQANHGVCVVELRAGRIAHWREYQRRGPFDQAAFKATEGKTWQWHIGNYP
jgi:ketosteroid isomerase-like protein